MGYNIYFSEKDWSFREAEMVKELEHRRLVKEAKATRITQKTDQKPGDLTSIETKTTHKVGKETLRWN